MVCTVVRLALAALLLTWAILSVEGQDIPVQYVDSAHLYAETKTNRVDVNSGNITLLWKDAQGVLKEGDHFRMRFSNFREEISWADSMNGTNCQYNMTEFAPFDNWRVWHSPNGPNGTTLIGMNATFAQNCEASWVLYLTNTLRQIKVGHILVDVRPGQAKLSVAINCPWRPVLNGAFNIDPSKKIWLLGRRLHLLALAEVALSTEITSFPEVTILPDYFNWSTWRVATLGLCNTDQPAERWGTYEYPTRGLPAGYNFSDIAGFFYDTQLLRTGVYFLGWAISDGEVLSQVQAPPDRNNFKVSQNLVQTPITITVPFANCILPTTGIQTVSAWFNSVYDPTLELLFYSDSSPSAEPSTTVDGLAVGVSVAVAAILGVAVALSVFLIMRSRAKREQKALRTKLETANGTRQASSSVTSPQASPVMRKDSSWQSGNVRNTDITNM